MGFRLRGGRPKQMRQGIYWVQRARDQQRVRASSYERVVRFNERYNRITGSFLSVYRPHSGADLKVRVANGSRLSDALDRYNELKLWIDANVEHATQSDLSKLATAAKRILIEIAKREAWNWCWEAKAKKLTINNDVLDFS
jgi:hypothetical protein